VTRQRCAGGFRCVVCSNATLANQAHCSRCRLRIRAAGVWSRAKASGRAPTRVGRELMYRAYAHGVLPTDPSYSVSVARRAACGDYDDMPAPPSMSSPYTDDDYDDSDEET